MISIQILSWNRPFRLLLTLISLKRILLTTKFQYEILLLDQNSNSFTKFIINLFDFNKKIFLTDNVGMAKGWELLFNNMNADAKFIVQLENDWWCNSINDDFLNTSLSALEEENCAFVKLRNNYDLQAGTNLINKEPQTVYPFPFDIFRIKFCDKNIILYSESKYSCFTFNPTLMKVEFRKLLENLYIDNKESNLSLLRSGEDFPTKFWEEQTKWYSAVISNSPFVHTGFHSRRYVYLKVPLFYFIEIFFQIFSIIKNIF